MVYTNLPTQSGKSKGKKEEICNAKTNQSRVVLNKNKKESGGWKMLSKTLQQKIADRQFCIPPPW